MRRTIDVSELRPADILLTTGRAFVSGAIRTTTGTDFSHAILYIGNNEIVEAVSDGVVKKPLSAALAEANLAIALRRRMMNDISRQAVVNNAKGFVGLPYDNAGAIGAGLSHNRGKLICATSGAFICAGTIVNTAINASDAFKDKKFFCSELVARSYELAGVPISDDSPSYMTPRSLRVAPTLMYVGHIIGGP